MSECYSCRKKNIGLIRVQYVVDMNWKTQQEIRAELELCHDCYDYIYPHGHWHLEDEDIPKIYKEKARELDNYKKLT